MGTYKEKLPNFGNGEIVVTKSSWHLEFYFSGPDMRYNGTFVRIAGDSIDRYVQAYKLNFEKYQLVKESNTLGGEVKLQGEMGMTINIGGFRDGVCIRDWHMPINSKRSLDNIINDLLWAKDRAEKAKILLNQL